MVLLWTKLSPLSNLSYCCLHFAQTISLTIQICGLSSLWWTFANGCTFQVYELLGGTIKASYSWTIKFTYLMFPKQGFTSYSLKNDSLLARTPRAYQDLGADCLQLHLARFKERCDSLY